MVIPKSISEYTFDIKISVKDVRGWLNIVTVWSNPLYFINFYQECVDMLKSNYS